MLGNTPPKPSRTESASVDNGTDPQHNNYLTFKDMKSWHPEQDLLHFTPVILPRQSKSTIWCWHLLLCFSHLMMTVPSSIMVMGELMLVSAKKETMLIHPKRIKSIFLSCTSKQWRRRTNWKMQSSNWRNWNTILTKNEYSDYLICQNAPCYLLNATADCYML